VPGPGPLLWSHWGHATSRQPKSTPAVLRYSHAESKRLRDAAARPSHAAAGGSRPQTEQGDSHADDALRAVPPTASSPHHTADESAASRHGGAAVGTSRPSSQERARPATARLPPYVIALGSVRGDELASGCAARNVAATAATLHHLVDSALPAVVSLVRATIAAHMMSARPAGAAGGRGWSCHGDPGRRVGAADVESLLASVRASLEGCDGASPPVAECAWGTHLASGPRGGRSAVAGVEARGDKMALVFPYDGSTLAALVADVCASPACGPALRGMMALAFAHVHSHAVAHIASGAPLPPSASSAGAPTAIVGSLALAMRGVADTLLAPPSPARGSNSTSSEPTFVEVANAQAALQRLTDVVMWQARL